MAPDRLLPDRYRLYHSRDLADTLELGAEKVLVVELKARNDRVQKRTTGSDRRVVRNLEHMELLVLVDLEVPGFFDAHP